MQPTSTASTGTTPVCEHIKKLGKDQLQKKHLLAVTARVY